MARPFIWTTAKEEAARLEWEGVPQGEIAERLGTTRRVIEGWMRRREVRARLAQLRAEGHRRFEAEWAERRRAVREGADWNVAEETDDTAQPDNLTASRARNARSATPHAQVVRAAPTPPHHRASTRAAGMPPAAADAAREREDALIDQRERVGRFLAQVTYLARFQRD